MPNGTALLQAQKRAPQRKRGGSRKDPEQAASQRWRLFNVGVPWQQDPGKVLLINAVHTTATLHTSQDEYGVHAALLEAIASMCNCQVTNVVASLTHCVRWCCQFPVSLPSTCSAPAPCQRCHRHPQDLRRPTQAPSLYVRTYKAARHADCPLTRLHTLYPHTYMCVLIQQYISVIEQQTIIE